MQPVNGATRQNTIVCRLKIKRKTIWIVLASAKKGLFASAKGLSRSERERLLERGMVLVQKTVVDA